MASRSSCAESEEKPRDTKTQSRPKGFGVGKSVLLDLFHVLFEVEHDEAAVAGADDAEEQLPLALLELEGSLVRVANVLERLDGLVADLGDDVEVGEPARA